MKLTKLMLQVPSIAWAPCKALGEEPVMPQQCHEIFLAHKWKKLERSLPTF
jgi:hypothetical protein